MRKLTSFFFLFLFFIYGCKSSNSGNDDLSEGIYSHTEDVGTSANDFLSSSSFTSLVIEVDYVIGYKPSQNALTNLKIFLESRLNKPGGITITLDDEIPSLGKSSYSAQDAYNLEKEHRNRYSDGVELASYFIVLDGQFEDENVLGFAYFNTSMALIGGTIEEHTGGLGQPSKAVVETAVLNHEFGHILGLVDNGSPAVQDHIDKEHGAHCDVESCLMYYAVRTSGFVANLMGGNVPELDEQCIQDLQANGGK
tara:strand:+ start:88635 stop:89393 length:759 start_codon:yes stop_codon:yes gene_type:complete